MIKKRNARNLVIVTPLVVFKLPRDGNVGRIFREFVLSWKAYLNGLAPFTVLFGPFLIQRTVPVLLKHLSPQKVVELAPKIERAIQRLSSLGIEHRELRHPENHVGFLGGRVVFIDFDRGRFSKKGRDLNKFRAWIEGVRKALGRAEKAGSRK